MIDPHSYQDVSNAYAAQLRNFFTPPETVGTAETRRAGTGVPVELLAERGETLAETSQQLGEMTTDYLAAEILAQREAAEMKLLAQAIAELETAQALLEEAEEETKRKSTAQETTRRAGVATSQQTSLEQLASILEAPLESGIEPLLPETTRRAATNLPTEPAQAKATLQKTVEMSLKSICRETSKAGWRTMNDLWLMDAAALRQGIAFVSQDAAELLDKIIEGLGGLILRLVKAALRLLGKAYTWIRALLGKELEEEARHQLGGWLEKLKQEQEQTDEGLFSKLVNRMYGFTALQSEVQNWLQTTQADVNQVNQATEGVDALAKRYQPKTKQVERLLTVIAFIKRLPALKTPQGQVIVTAVMLGVLGYIFYIGHDHVRDGRIVLNEQFSFNIPDRVEGVRKVVQKALAIV